jgi:hypothetical protein
MRSQIKPRIVFSSLLAMAGGQTLKLVGGGCDYSNEGGTFGTHGTSDVVVREKLERNRDVG